jgi:hypothetical protein
MPHFQLFEEKFKSSWHMVMLVPFVGEEESTRATLFKKLGSEKVKFTWTRVGEIEVPSIRYAVYLSDQDRSRALEMHQVSFEMHSAYARNSEYGKGQYYKAYTYDLVQRVFDNFDVSFRGVELEETEALQKEIFTEENMKAHLKANHPSLKAFLSQRGKFQSRNFGF